MSDVTIRRHDTARALTATLMIGASPVDLTGADVVLVWRRPDGTARRTATVTSASAGGVTYQPVAEDTGTAGLHWLEWEVTFSDSRVLTVPTLKPVQLRVIADMG